MTPHPETPWFPLVTERLTLREFREDDFADVHAYASDPEVSRFMDWGPNTEDETRAFLGRAIDAQIWPRDGVSLAVEITDEARVIGSIRLDVKPDQAADFGYSLGRPYWRRGYASEATAALLAVAFGVLGVHRVWATCDTRNRASFGVMEKLGMRREATFRQDKRMRDGWRDTHLYAILVEEWAAQPR